jgi:hypothetical protein
MDILHSIVDPETTHIDCVLGSIHSLQENSGTVNRTGPRPLSSKIFRTHDVVFSLRHNLGQPLAKCQFIRDSQ